MTETGKIGPSHLRRSAVVYVRQSSASQVERNTESTARQYDLASRAVALGWPARSAGHRRGSRAVGRLGRRAVRLRRAGRPGGLGQVGMVLASRSPAWPATTADWYRLLDLAG